ncbi:uncharacterized protein LOC105188464 isoform X1 [Harpegnathos saltator]|uniref:uncharacterized protein LOC105188464 isoform X1 n=1 Tax=Harpegnathos saltator TaxID=610380 RepID=UPI0005902445|nr:uncharacterized protein LOC105188464 isoform X1 [Harpegnathos saltator]
MQTTDMMCEVDSHCPNGQFCFFDRAESFCIDYIVCKEYNRKQVDEFTRNPSQCGECLDGFMDEILSTGDPALYCKLKASDPTTYSTTFNKSTIWAAIMSCIALVTILVILCVYIIKRRNSRRLGVNDVLKNSGKTKRNVLFFFRGRNAENCYIPPNIIRSGKCLCTLPQSDINTISIQNLLPGDDNNTDLSAQQNNISPFLRSSINEYQFNTNNRNSGEIIIRIPEFTTGNENFTNP